MFPNPWVDKAVLMPSDMQTLLKYYKQMVFMIVLGIHCNFFIVLPTWLKTCRSNAFFFFTRQKMRTWFVGRVPEVLCIWTRRSASGTQFVQACRGIFRTQLHIRWSFCETILYFLWCLIGFWICPAYHYHICVIA